MRYRLTTARLFGALGLAACSHSAPFTGGEGSADSPFADLRPLRLTFDAGADLHPHWTPDGALLLYTFERLLPAAEYPDRCLGALPPDGGQRVHDWCWPGWDEGSRRDGIEAGMLRPDGRLFFVHHYGAGLKQPNPHKASAYVAEAGSIASPTRLFDLLVPHPGATARWDYFLSPVFTGSDEVTGLGAAVTVAQPCPTCTWDTVYTGLDLVRVRLDQPESITVLARIGRAEFLSLDASTDRFFFARDGRVETIGINGGEPELVWQVPRSPDRDAPTITGVAAAAGRLAVSYQWLEAGERRNRVGLLDGHGDIEEIVFTTGYPRWGELALSPDGRRLVVERRDANGERDLYLYQLP